MLALVQKPTMRTIYLLLNTIVYLDKGVAGVGRSPSLLVAATFSAKLL